MHAILFAVTIATLGGPPGAMMFGAQDAARDGARACRALALKTSASGPAALKRLDQLPPAALEHAVLRSLGGCPVREIVEHGRIRFAPSPVPRPLQPAR